MRKIIFLIALSIFINSCKNLEEENFVKDLPRTEKKNEYFDGTFFFKNSPFDELKNREEFKHLINRLDLDSYFASNDTDYEKAKIKEKNTDIRIFTESVKEIRLKEYVSFKFRIDRGSQRKGLFEYLLLVKNKDEENAYIISQVPDSVWLSGYLKGSSEPFKGQINIEQLNSPDFSVKAKINSCTELYYYVDVTCSCANHTVEDACTCAASGGSGPERIWFKSINCNAGGGWGTPSHVPGPPSHEGGSLPNNVLIAEDGSNPAPIILTDRLHLSGNLTSWLQANMDLAGLLLMYNVDNGLSPESDAFLSWAINYMVANGNSVAMIQASLQMLNEDPSLKETVVMNVVTNFTSYRMRMAAAEIAIFDTLTWYQKIAYLNSADQASEQANAWYPSTIINGLGDAFRHAYWNALCVKRLGASLTISLTNAHETAYDPAIYEYYWKDRDMDLFNNNVGRDYAGKSYILLPALIKFALEAGELRYLTPLGAYINGTWDNTAANASSVLKPTNE